MATPIQPDPSLPTWPLPYALDAALRGDLGPDAREHATAAARARIAYLESRVSDLETRSPLYGGFVLAADRHESEIATLRAAIEVES